MDIYNINRNSRPYCFGYTKRELNELSSDEWSKEEREVIDTYGYAMFERV